MSKSERSTIRAEGVMEFVKTLTEERRARAVQLLSALDGTKVSIGDTTYGITMNEGLANRAILHVLERFSVLGYDSVIPDSVLDKSVFRQIIDSARGLVDSDLPYEDTLLEIINSGTKSINKSSSLPGNVISVGNRVAGQTKPSEVVVPYFDQPMIPGCVAIVGDSRAGKTTFAVTNLKPTVILRFGERMESWDWEPGVMPGASLTDVILNVLVFNALGASVLVDSFRFLAFNLKGTTGEKGISNAILTFSTSLSSLVSRVEGLTYFILNPQSAELAQSLFTAIIGSVQGAIFLRDYVIEDATVIGYDGMWRWSSSDIDNPNKSVVDSEEVVGDITSITSGMALVDPNTPHPAFKPHVRVYDSPDDLDEEDGPIRGTRFNISL